MSAIEEFRPGLYRHYKGPLYQALFLAHDANADTLVDGSGRTLHEFGERVVVVYIACELDQAHTGIRPAVRTLEDWNKILKVHRIDKTVCDQPCNLRGDYHNTVPRFEYVGAEYRP